MQALASRLMQELKEALLQIYGENLRGLYLYGSYARREEDPGSDVDVVILLRDFADYWEEIQRTSHIISELSLKYSITVSPVRVRESNWLHEESPFLNSVRKECVPL